MTSVSSSRPAQSPRPAGREPQAAPQPQQAGKPEDLRAMSDAFARARAKVDRFAAGKEAPPERAPVMPRPRTAEREAPRRPIAADRGTDQQQAAAVATAPPAPPPALALPAMPAAHVDPSGFAQMLADLWTRENGKGAKEVRVRFGDNAWPATGALLVRNAAGTLDVALSVGDAGAAYGDRLGSLSAQLREAGLPLGALALEA